MSETNGIYFAIKRLEIHDGPGVRTTLFLKGCPLRCLWCHNPEGLSALPVLAHYSHKCINCGACVSACSSGAHVIENGMHRFLREKCVACGKCESVCLVKANKLFGITTTASQILFELLLDKSFYEKTGGGVTISGGEPLLQPDFVCELVKLLKAEGVHTAIDTSLSVPINSVERVASVADMFLCDIKAIDDDLHRRLTGLGSRQILDNIKHLDSIGMPMEIRVPLIPNMNDAEVKKIADFISQLKSVHAVKALAYHDLARTKYSALGLEYPMADTLPPTKDRLAEVQSLLTGALGKKRKE